MMGRKWLFVVCLVAVLIAVLAFPLLASPAEDVTGELVVEYDTGSNTFFGEVMALYPVEALNMRVGAVYTFMDGDLQGFMDNYGLFVELDLMEDWTIYVRDYRILEKEVVIGTRVQF